MQNAGNFPGRCKLPQLSLKPGSTAEETGCLSELGRVSDRAWPPALRSGELPQSRSREAGGSRCRDRARREQPRNAARQPHKHERKARGRSPEPRPPSGTHRWGGGRGPGCDSGRTRGWDRRARRGRPPAWMWTDSRRRQWRHERVQREDTCSLTCRTGRPEEERRAASSADTESVVTLDTRVRCENQSPRKQKDPGESRMNLPTGLVARRRGPCGSRNRDTVTRHRRPARLSPPGD